MTSRSTVPPTPPAAAAVVIKAQEESDLARMSTALGIKFRTLFESLSPLLVEGVLTFAENGATIRSTNMIIASEVKFLADENEATSVEDYVFRGDKPISVGVSFENLQSCLSAVGPSDIVSFRILEEGLHASRPWMILSIAHPSQSYFYSFKIDLLCLENITKTIPKISFRKVVSLPSNLFLKILRTCSKRGDSICVKTTKRENGHFLSFSPYNERKHCGTFDVKFETEDDEEAVCEKKELYSLKYLLLISKCANLSNSIQIYLKNESVLGIGIRVGVIGRAFFALAPCRDVAQDNTFNPPLLSILSDAKFKNKISKNRRKPKGSKRKRTS